jgi:hypothetical protein
MERCLVDDEDFGSVGSYVRQGIAVIRGNFLKMYIYGVGGGWVYFKVLRNNNRLIELARRTLEAQLSSLSPGLVFCKGDADPERSCRRGTAARP